MPWGGRHRPARLRENRAYPDHAGSSCATPLTPCQSFSIRLPRRMGCEVPWQGRGYGRLFPSDVARHRRMDEAGPRPTVERSFAGLAIEVLESIADGFLAVDSDWRVVYFNLRASELLRVEHDGVVGHILWERFPELLGTDAEKRLRRAVASGRAVDYEMLSPKVRRWFAVRVRAMAGGLTGVYWRDITERKEDEAALRRSNDQLLLAMEAAGFGTWEHEINTDARHWSDQARRLIGVTPEAEASYEVFINAIAPADRD